MKPASIKKFDMLYLGSIVVSLVGVVLGWDTMMADMNTQMSAQGTEMEGMEGIASGAAIGGLALGFAISLLLWALVSVWRVEFVKWILALFAAWGVVSLLLSLGAGVTVATVFAIASTVMGVVAVYFLFQPDAKEWFASK